MSYQMLLNCIARRDLAAVKSLLASGRLPANGSWWRRTLTEEPTPLIAAVKARAPEIVACLLDFGANPDLRSRKWMEPLALACQEGERTIAEMLANRGANINPIRNAFGQPTPIEAAAWRGQEDLVAFLLERGANPAPVFARGTGSLIRIRRAILLRLIAAADVVPDCVKELVDCETRDGTAS
ncbi:MAG: ankyrin repeat domain-containing protein [Verrucomicrobia bacterium]|nr:ankyrin repeat domain-containing protein [Verrucomicrobiota bacterium]